MRKNKRTAGLFITVFAAALLFSACTSASPMDGSGGKKPTAETADAVGTDFNEDAVYDLTAD